jgi:hypothetical protein
MVLYEAISVGTADAISGGKHIKPKVLQGLLNDAKLKQLTTGATNSKNMVIERMEYVNGKL